MRGMKTLTNSTSWRQWLLFKMSHPPNELQRWMIARSAKSSGMVALLLFFPLTYIKKLFLLLARGAIVNKNEQGVIHSIAIYFKSITPIWFTMIILVLLWPLISSYWVNLTCKLQLSKSTAFNYKEFTISTLILLSIWILVAMLR